MKFQTKSTPNIVEDNNTIGNSTLFDVSTSCREMSLTRWTLLITAAVLIEVTVSYDVLSDSVPYRTINYLNESLGIHPFYDRLVAIILNGSNPNGFRKNYVTVSPGVLFDENHLLTSFNPYRQMIKQRKAMSHVRVAILVQKEWNGTQSLGGDFRLYEIDCARQVNPIADKHIGKQRWFGHRKLHNPVHDLIVMRLKEKVEFVEESSLFNFTNMYKGMKNSSETKSETAGPLKSTLASLTDFLGKEVAFASLGLVSDYYIWMGVQLWPKLYTQDDNAIVDCEEWLPRDWGYFICLKNMDKYAGVGSGSVLVYNRTVFGIGSFMIERQSRSIFVFTDVRKYHHLIINNTCSDLDDPS